jgi:hypothetical protein
MMNNFTPRAQQVLALAIKEAERFNHNYVGTEHLLLGLIKLGEGVAVNVLQKMGLDLEIVRKEVEKQVGPQPETKMIGNIPYTPRVKKVLAIADKEAKALNHSYVGTEHILLGLLREGDGVAARVLKNMDVDIEQTRQEILKELDPNFNSAEEGTPAGEGGASEKSEKKGEVKYVRALDYTLAGASVHVTDAVDTTLVAPRTRSYEQAGAADLPAHRQAARQRAFGNDAAIDGEHHGAVGARPAILRDDRAPTGGNRLFSGEAKYLAEDREGDHRPAVEQIARPGSRET